MTCLPRGVALASLMLALLAAPSWGAPAKLDARARAALAGLRAGGRSIAALRARGVAIDREGALDVFIRGPVTRAELEAAGARVRTALPGLFTASIPASAVERVAALAGVRAIRGGAHCEPELDVSVPSTGAQTQRGAGPTFAGINGQGVIVGIVDSGVDFDHGDFKDAAGLTRIVSMWDQVAAGSGPPGFSYGTECTAAQITAGTCLERDSLEHGTHITSIAAGDGSQAGGARPPYTFAGMAPRADLVVVKTDFETPEVIDGINYIFGKATERGANAVVNLSLGSHYGSHDGLSEFEQAVTALSGPGRIVVKSAGNDRGKAVHAQVFATAGGASATMLVSGSAVDRYLDIDGYYNTTEQLRVEVTSPHGTTIGPMSLNSENAPWPGASTPDGVVYVAHDTLPDGRNNVYLEIYCEQSNKKPDGTWTIRFIADQLGSANGEVDLWQYFASTGMTASFVTGNQPTRELITEPGNAADVVTVGSWVTKTSWTGCNGVSWNYGMPAAGNLAPSSSPGPTRDGRQKPDLTAPGSAVAAATTFDIPHACPGASVFSEFINDGLNHRVLQGTSVAAPHVTGAVALLLQSRGALTPSQVVTYLRTHARADAFTGAVPTYDWGYGKLDVGDLIAPVATLSSPNGGETLTPGEIRTITWTATDTPPGAVASIDLQLSRTGPAGPFEAIVSGIANSGTYDWLVTPGNTIGSVGHVRVIAHDTNENLGTDVGNAGFVIAGPVSAEREGEAVFALGAVHPNPARLGATIDFSLARASHVSLRVHDIQGRTVAVLADEMMSAGPHRADWAGTRGGTPARSGLYFVRYDTPEGRFVKRIVVAR